MRAVGLVLVVGLLVSGMSITLAPAGSSSETNAYAVAVIEHRYCSDARSLLGAPQRGWCGSSAGSYADIQANGYVIVEVGCAFNLSPDNDLRVYEVPGNDGFVVSVSADLCEWVGMTEIPSATRGIRRPYCKPIAVDCGTSEVVFRYVKIEGIQVPGSVGSVPGCEIAAIEALHPRESE